MLEFDENHKSVDNLSEKITVINTVVSEEKMIVDGETINLKDMTKAIKAENELEDILPSEVDEHEEENEIKK